MTGRLKGCIIVLLFDWKKVYDAADGNIPTCNTIMEMLINQQIPRNKFDRIYKYSNKKFTGSCFLLHGELLLYHSYKYTQKAVPKNYNQFWTPMGQPRQQQQQKVDIGIMQTSIENKEKSPRKEKKKKPKPK